MLATDQRSDPKYDTITSARSVKIAKHQHAEQSCESCLKCDRFHRRLLYPFAHTTTNVNILCFALKNRKATSKKRLARTKRNGKINTVITFRNDLKSLEVQDAQLSQRDRAAGCVIVFAKSRKPELGDNILRTL